MTEKDINGLLYQDSHAYRIGRKDNIEGFGQWEGVSTKEPREVELKLEMI